MNLFSKNLRFLRKKGNHNQDEIALLFNKQPNTVGNWENRKSEPSLQELIRLGEFFKVSTEDLLLRDLELSPQGSSVSLAEASFSLPLRSYNGADYAAGMAGETGADAFWLILRELRAIHEKVELLIADRESAGRKRNSDKSNH
jgi:transcriptional regulator with XRE-family HTH domain